MAHGRAENPPQNNAEFNSASAAVPDGWRLPDYEPGIFGLWRKRYESLNGLASLLRYPNSRMMSRAHRRLIIAACPRSYFEGLAPYDRLSTHYVIQMAQTHDDRVVVYGREADKIMLSMECDPLNEMPTNNSFISSKSKDSSLAPSQRQAIYPTNDHQDIRLQHPPASDLGTRVPRAG